MPEIKSNCPRCGHEPCDVCGVKTWGKPANDKMAAISSAVPAVPIVWNAIGSQRGKRNVGMIRLACVNCRELDLYHLWAKTKSLFSSRCPFVVITSRAIAPHGWIPEPELAKMYSVFAFCRLGRVVSK